MLEGKKEREREKGKEREREAGRMRGEEGCWCVSVADLYLVCGSAWGPSVCLSGMMVRVE